MKTRILNKIYLYLALISKYYISKKDVKIIWITWSVWKTSSRMIISEILSKKLLAHRVYTSPKNFNSELWLALSIFKVETSKPSSLNLLKNIIFLTLKAIFTKPKYDVLLLEYWIDKVWDMDHLLSIVKPNIWIVTKLDKVHAEYFSDIDEIWNEKFKLLHNSKDFCYLNALDDFSMTNYDSVKQNKTCFYADSKQKPSYDSYKTFKEDWTIKCSFNVNLDENSFEVKTNLLWKENSAYIALAYDILSRHFDYKVHENEELFINLQPGRFSILKGINQSIIVDSSYNASPISMSKMLDNLSNIKNNIAPDYRVILCIWDMRELWSFTWVEHKNISWKIIWLADYLVTIWPETEKYTVPELEISGFSWVIHSYKKSNEAWFKIKEIIENDSKNKYLVFFKWSQNTIFTEEAIKPILLNKKDSKKLCRQEKDWIKTKSKFFAK